MSFVKTKHFFIFIVLFLSFFLTNCQKNKVIKSHGIFYLENRDKLLKINDSNTNDVIRILGYPHTKSIQDQNIWLYIERTKTRGGIHKLGKNILLNNNVLVIKFDKYGILEEKLLYNKNDMNSYKFAEAETENNITKGSFIESFLSSIREKMLSNRKD
tara:strand:- start:16 stop:489 length:474 start_codon:yes stop_codon:yes gene_type:complete